MVNLRTNLLYALYCASIIIGAGVLAMPLTGPLLGFGPLLVVTVVVGLWQIAIYRRMAHSTFVNASREASKRVEEIREPIAAGLGILTDSQKWRDHMKDQMMLVEVRKGAALIDQVIQKTGIGLPGLTTLFLGTLLYVFIANIGYILIGSRSLNAVSQALAEQGSPLPLILPIIGIALVTAGFALPMFISYPSARRGAIQKMLAMAGCWSLGIGVLALLQDSGSDMGGARPRDALGSGLFLAAILAAMFVGSKAVDERDKQHGLNAQHRVNVVVMIVELGLLAVTAVLVLSLFISRGLTEPFFTLAPETFSLAQMPNWARVMGIVLFAYVGTGIFNLCSYPQLFQGNAGRRTGPHFGHVVMLGTVIPMAVYLGWTLVTALTLSPRELALGDGNNQATHILIAAKAAPISPITAWAITLTGYLFALMAVTSACNGFTESLAERIDIALSKFQFWQKNQFDLRPLILFSAASVALAKDMFSTSVDISSILALAGSAGGGLLILILPMFFPYPAERRTRVRYWEIGVVLLSAAVLVLIILYNPITATGTAQQVILWTKRIAAISVGVMTLWLLLSEPPD